VFLFLVALQGILLNVLSVRWFRKISAYVQGAMVFVLLWLFFLFPNIAMSVAQLKARDAWELYAFPPAWFLGLNEAILGTRDAAFLALARRAELALALVFVIAALSYTVAYRRHVRKTLESIDGSGTRRTVLDDRLSDLADALIRDPAARASVAFTGKTIARSARHRIFLAAYAGVGCALCMQALAGAQARDAALSIPLILSFFILSGMRFIFTIPAELPANWMFRVTETNQQSGVLSGVRSAMRWLAVAPLFTVLVPFYFLRWPPGVAFAHLFFSVVISLLLIEALTLDFWKIPFSCSYPPGKANITLLWVFYWTAFLLYAYYMAALESWMVKRPVRLLLFYLAMAMLFAALRWYRNRTESAGITLIFDDSADPVVRTLGLGELAWLRSATAGNAPSSLPRAPRPK
jgi:hypothetical protein